MQSKTITDPELGAIKFTKYKGAKNIRLKVAQHSGLKVSLPFFVSYDEAMRFLISKRLWVQEQLKAFRGVTYNKEALLARNLIKAITDHALRFNAHQYLPNRLAELASKHNLKYRRVFIRNNRTRWGSCSSVNNINLCIQLMRLPGELIDYVILHELAHTIHKNHSVKFWAYLSELLGQDAKSIDKGLKQYKLY